MNCNIPVLFTTAQNKMTNTVFENYSIPYEYSKIHRAKANDVMVGYRKNSIKSEKDINSGLRTLSLIYCANNSKNNRSVTSDL